MDDSTAVQSDGGSKSVALKESFVGAQPMLPYGSEQSPTRINYYIGEQSNWKENVPAYNTISFGEAWNGIFVDLKASNNNVEKIFTIQPGANVKDIRLAVEGISGLSVDNNSGELVLESEPSDLRLTSPVAFQEINGITIPISVSYIALGNLEYGFQMGSDYNPDYALTIDPLIASTFVGGSNTDIDPIVAWSPPGQVVIAAQSSSADYPTTLGVINEGPPSLGDVVVSRLSDDLTTLEMSTFLGGANGETPFAVAVDAGGNIYVAGTTDSSNFPTTAGAYDTTSPIGGRSAFISEIRFTGAVLMASTLLGGADTEDAIDEIHSIIVTVSDVYVAGWTEGPTFPIVGGADSTFAGAEEGFIARLDPALTSLTASTFLGGGSVDEVEAIAVDSSSHIYVTGRTTSGNFPTTAGAYDTSHAGSSDVFVTHLNPALSSIIASTYLGDVQFDLAYSIAVSPTFGVYVSGRTLSPFFPTAGGSPYDTSHNGDYDVFVSGLSPSLGALQYSTFIGGPDVDFARAMAIGPSDDIYLVVQAGLGYPTTAGAYDETHNGNNEIAVSKLSHNLSTLSASTFIGGTDVDAARSISIHPSGDVFVAGSALSTDYPTTVGAYSENNAGDFDLVISRFTEDLAADDIMPPLITNVVDAPDPFAPNIGETTTISFDSNEAGTYTIQILDGSLMGGANLTGTMIVGTNDAVWDGTGFTPSIVPDGTYQYQVEAIDGSGNKGLGAQPLGTNTITVASVGGPDIVIANVDNPAPRWDLDLVNVDGTYSGAIAGDCIVVAWGDGSTDEQAVAPGSGTWGFNHIYGEASVGPVTITARLQNPCSNPAILKDTDTSLVNVQPHATSLTLDPIRDVTATTGFTLSGRLIDADISTPVSGQIITFDGNGATGTLQPAVTQGVTFGSAGPLDLESCPVPSACDADTIGGIDPNPADNNVLRLSVGDTISFPPSTVQTNLFIQGMGTDTFKYVVEEWDGTLQPEAVAGGAAPNVAILQIISGYSPVGGDVVPDGIKTLTITEVGGAPGNTVGIAAILTLNPEGLPREQHVINFEDLTAGPQPATFTINSGSFYSTGFAQNVDEDGLDVTAHFGGTPQYLASDSSTELYDALANTGGIGGEGSQSLGSSGGSVTVLSCGTNSDSDSDAICDNWEAGGVTFGTATYQLTADGGAAIGQKDIFVEIDCMTGFCPTTTDTNAVESAFAAEGFTLHLVLDETNLVVKNPLHVWTDADGDATNDYDSIKKAHFGTSAERTTAGGNLGQGKDLLEAKAQVFRYILFAQNVNTGTSVACGPSGQAELGGNDAIVSVGCTSGTNKFTNTAQERQGTLMHELGHMLGLRHGGNDDDNCKPNLISVMSYSRQMPWASLSATTAAGAPIEWKLTYSRQALADLDEGSLAEGTGLAITSGQWGGTTAFKLIWGNPGGTPSVLTGSTGPNVNWDGAGSATGSGITLNVNKLAGVLGCDTGTTESVLRSYDEWSLITLSDLNFRDSGNIDGAVYPDPDTLPEMTPIVLEGLQKLGNQFQGVHQPINDVSIGESGMSVFKKSSTIPIMFQLLDSEGNTVTNLDVTNIRLKIAAIGTGLPADGDYSEPVSSNPSSTGDQFSYDATTGTWQFNLGTKNMVANKQYAIRIIVDLGLPTEALLDHNGDGVTAVFALK
ncbi:MAG TPA: SBBP repeat-containing protein [Nitrososphaera sp.]|nr:SBBP repeat-containing protein [Nitrososphaera sp.]